MGKEGWCVGLEWEGLREGGGTVWNTLKGGETEKKLGQEVGTLKSVGGG